MTKERRKKLTITGQVQTKKLLIKKKIIYFLDQEISNSLE